MPRDSTWIWVIRSVSQAFRTARSEGGASGARSSPTSIPRAPGRRLAQGSSRRPSPRPPRISFWARLLPQQLHGTTRRLQLSLELSDALVRRGQLGLLLARPSRDEFFVDPVEAPRPSAYPSPTSSTTDRPPSRAALRGSKVGVVGRPLARPPPDARPVAGPGPPGHVDVSVDAVASSFRWRRRCCPSVVVAEGDAGGHHEGEQVHEESTGPGAGRGLGKGTSTHRCDPRWGRACVCAEPSRPVTGPVHRYGRSCGAVVRRAIANRLATWQVHPSGPAGPGCGSTLRWIADRTVGVEVACHGL
jgi:hypothetical protein